MKKVLFLINSLKIGGAEKAFVNQANGLMGEGLDVYFGVLEHREGPLTLLGNLKVEKGKYFCFNLRNLYDLKGCSKIAKVTRENGITLVYSTLPAANLVARLAKIFNPKLKVVIREANVASVKSLKMKAADVLLFPLTCRIIAVSEIVKKSLEKYLFFGKGKIKVLCNSVELPQKSGGLEKIRKKYGLEGKYAVLNVGALNARQKGQIFALKSLQQLVEAGHKDIRLLLAGDVRVKQEWADFIKENKLEEFVVFLGYLPPAELAKIYDIADLFILPSLWEGFPNVVLEAMAHGCPVIATDVGGVREAIDDGRNGLVIGPKDVNALTNGILKIKNDPDLASRFSRNGLKTIKEKFLFEVNLPKLIEIKKDVQSASINLENLDPYELRRRIVSLYIAGYDIITMNGQTGIKQHEETIKDVIDGLIALEIIEQTKEKIVAKDLLDPSQFSLDSTVRRVNIIIRAMMDVIKNDPEEYENLTKRDFDVNRLVYLSLRIIKKKLKDRSSGSKVDPVALLGAWDLLNNLEHLADELKRIGRNLKACKHKNQRLIKEFDHAFDILVDEYDKIM